MTDIKKLAFVGLASLGLITFGSVGCSSSNNSGTGGSGGTSSGTGGTSSHTGGATGSGGTSAGTGGSGGALLGCAMSDAPAGADIATFASADGGIAAMFGTFTYGDTPKPTFTTGSNMVNVMDTVQIDSKNHFQGFGIYFNGNAAGTDCLDASSFTGVQFDMSGSLTGTGCTMQFSINDSEHTNPASSTPPDVKASGVSTSYSPQVQITSAQLTSTSMTIMVPFAATATGAPSGGSPATAIDPTKLEGVQWQLSTPIASDAGATECVWNFNIANVKFYK
jgi:hypothetical protein